MAPIINFSGLASGIDSDALIKATSEASRKVRVTPNQDKITELTSQNDAFDELRALLATLKTKLLDFSTLSGGPLAKSALSSDEAVLTASASSSSSNGTYQLTVDKLATNGTYSFAAAPGIFTSSTSTVGTNSGTQTVEIGTGSSKETINIDFTPSTTMSDWVTSFNSKSELAVASLINVAQPGATADYRIVISTYNTGTEKGTIAVSGTSPDKFDVAVTASNPASDAEFSVSGIDGTIKRASNTVSDLITGVTFNLKGEGGPTSITVNDDITETQEKMQDMLDAWNKVISYVNENNKIEREENGENVTNTYGTLAKTRLDDNLLTSLRSALSSSAYSEGTKVKIFADIGITTDSGQYNETAKTGGGLLKFDTKVFAEAMSSEPNSINELVKKFADTLALTNGTIDQYTRFNGLFDSSINGNKELVSDLNDRIAEAESQILKTEDIMRQRFARLESVIGKMQSQGNALSSALAGLSR